NIDWTHSTSRHMDSLILHPHHLWDTRPTNIHVHDSHLRLFVKRKSPCKHRCECGLADAAFARENQDLVLDGGEAGGDERNVGIRAFGGRGADRLVGTAGACVCLAGLLAFWAGTVLGRW